MEWIYDETGRFLDCPHWKRAELEELIKNIGHSFLARKYGRVRFPIDTEDLKILVEESVEDLDLYHEFSGKEANVEGLTIFLPGHRPLVRIARSLSEDPRSELRLRLTLAHEFGHVCLHAQVYARERNIRDSNNVSSLPINSSAKDWMEWQAFFFAGALLMPETNVLELVHSLCRSSTIFEAKRFLDRSERTQRQLINLVAWAFQTSKDAARIWTCPLF
jgi:hypothetical protein